MGANLSHHDVGPGVDLADRALPVSAVRDPRLPERVREHLVTLEAVRQYLETVDAATGRDQALLIQGLGRVLDRHPMGPTLTFDADAGLDFFPSDRPLNQFNLPSDREPWAPVARAVPGHVLELHMFHLEAAVRGYGIGRYVINVLEQALTRNPNLPQWLWIATCYYPTFQTIDTHYGWLRTSLVPQGTPAALIYPKHLSPTTGAQYQENKQAIWKYTHLQWTTPVEWGVARASQWFTARPDVDAWRHVFMDLNEKLARVKPTEPEHHLVVFPPSLIRLLGLTGINVPTAPLSMTLPRTPDTDTDTRVARALSAHCFALGNSDDGHTGATHVPALFLRPDCFVPADGLSPVVWELVLGFLIDHCRVMYRPLGLSHTLVQRLVALYHVEAAEMDLNVVLARMVTLPRPRPVFTQLNRHMWLWVPVKKPTSSSHDGHRYSPPPAREEPPLVIQEMEEEESRPKRIRLEGVVSM
jgi:hypothetical protein